MRLDVEKRRHVETVEPGDDETARLDAPQGDDGRGDRIGPHGRAQSKGSNRFLAGGRLDHKVAPRFVHPIEKLQFRPLLDAGQRLMPERIDDDAAFGPLLAITLPRTVRPLLPRCANMPDKIELCVARAGLLKGYSDFAGPDRFIHRFSNPLYIASLTPDDGLLRRGLDMTFDRAAFIKTNTHLALVPLRPDIKLHLAEEATGLWQKTQDELHAVNLPLPYWAFAWPGGQALARYIQDHQTLVAGKRVLDLGSGSGLLAIAAAKAGAAHVEANDIDPLAMDAISMNAVANSADIHLLSEDVVGCDQHWDVVLAGDIAYEPGMAERFILWLEQLANKGTRVLIGDPGRTYLPRDRLHSLAHYEVPVSKCLEDCETKMTDVWRFKDAM